MNLSPLLSLLFYAGTPLLALGLDRWLGEPARYHPLAGFGHAAMAIERRLHRYSSKAAQRLSGVLALLVLLVPLLAISVFLLRLPWVGPVFSIVILYFCVGQQSLHEHARAIKQPLAENDIDGARRSIGRIVSRDTDHMNATQITRATVESVLENGNDAVFATLFWFFLFGAPGALLLRLSNTLDAMWGYRTAHYLHFGWAAARLDDVLGFIPARLTALSYALQGHTRSALQCWHTQAKHCASPNGGVVMTAGAGTLQVILGGGASYHGQWQDKPIMGDGAAPTADTIERSLALVRHGAWAWALLWALAATVWLGWMHA